MIEIFDTQHTFSYFVAHIFRSPSNETDRAASVKCFHEVKMGEFYANICKMAESYVSKVPESC